MSGKVLVQIDSGGFDSGGSYAPCMYVFRILNQKLRAKCVEQISSINEEAAHDNVLLSDDDAMAIVPARHWNDFRNGWTVCFKMDRFEALTIYGYDCNTL